MIVTEWSDLKELARPEVRTAMKSPLIVDGRNFLDPAAVRRAGFAYEGIGRPSLPVEELESQPVDLTEELARSVPRVPAS